jgi:hypothetical protein
MTLFRIVIQMGSRRNSPRMAAGPPMISARGLYRAMILLQASPRNVPISKWVERASRSPERTASRICFEDQGSGPFFLEILEARDDPLGESSLEPAKDARTRNYGLQAADVPARAALTLLLNYDGADLPR